MARLVLLSTAAAACLLAAGPALADEPPPLERPPNYVPSQALEMSDPLERFNRTMFSVDKKLMKWLGGRAFPSPARILPGKVRRGVYNVFSNLGEPVSAANQALQGKWSRAGVSMGRFGANTTVGLLGTKDVASDMGMTKHSEDFGQTLATYGVPGGPYVYLPLLGPGNVRDRVGGRVDGLANPLGMVDAGMIGGAAIDGVQSMSQPQSAMSIRERASIAAEAGQTDDEYAMVRDLYYAKRAAQIEDAAGADEVPAPYWDDEDADVQYADATPPPPPRDLDRRRAQPDQRYARAASPRYPGAYAPPPPRAYAPPPRPRSYPPPGYAYGYGYAPPPPAYRDRAAERAAAQAAADAAYWQSAYVGWDDDRD